MTLPVHIHFRNIPRSEAVESAIRRKAERLTEITFEPMELWVSVETPHHHRKGFFFTLPGGEKHEALS